MAPVYVLDTCVLYLVVLRDLLLTLATLTVFEPRWTDEIIDEMTRNVLADRPDIDDTQFAERGGSGDGGAREATADVAGRGRRRAQSEPHSRTGEGEPSHSSR